MEGHRLILEVLENSAIADVDQGGNRRKERADNARRLEGFVVGLRALAEAIWHKDGDTDRLIHLFSVGEGDSKLDIFARLQPDLERGQSWDRSLSIDYFAGSNSKGRVERVFGRASMIEAGQSNWVDDSVYGALLHRETFSTDTTYSGSAQLIKRQATDAQRTFELIRDSLELVDPAILKALPKEPAGSF